MSERTILNPPISLSSGSAILEVESLTATSELVSSYAQIGVGTEVGDIIFQLGLPAGPYSNFLIGTGEGNPLQCSSGFSATAGNITATAGNVVASGSMTAGTTITASGIITGTELAISSEYGDVTLSGSPSGLTVSSGMYVSSDLTVVDTITVSVGNITAPAGNISCATGTMTAQSFAGGIGSLVGSIAINLSAGQAQALTTTLINFIGSASTAYVISYNNQGAFPIFISAGFSATQGADTVVNINIYNGSATESVSTTLLYSLIAMN